MHNLLFFKFRSEVSNINLANTNKIDENEQKLKQILNDIHQCKIFQKELKKLFNTLNKKLF